MKMQLAAGLVLGALFSTSTLSAERKPIDGELARIATNSECARYDWKHGRHRAPASYIAGVALVFARAICHPERADVEIVSRRPDENVSKRDALLEYKGIFTAAGMSNENSGPDTLRHTYTLLLGLGMMESSGKYCEGRDVSQCFAAAESAEAGLFQASYGARVFSKTALDALFTAYRNDQSSCLLDTFKGSIQCSIRTSKNKKCPDATSDIAGTGVGASWQRLTKSCPAFATEYAAVVLRTNGRTVGKRKGEFNPILKHEAEVRKECDSMLKQIQMYVSNHPQACSGL